MADHDDVPSELDPQLRVLVSAYETATARDVAQVDAALARVLTKASVAGSGGATALSMTAKIGIVGGLAGIVAVVGIVAFGPSRETPSPRTTTETASSVSTSPRVVDAMPRSVEAVVAPVIDREAPTVDDTPEDATHRPAKLRVSSSSRAADPPPSESDSLKAELELLRQARSALRGGHAADALEIVRRHRREYPSSAVVEERDATEVSALCALGRTDDAKAKAATIERRSSRPAADLLRGCE